MLSEFFKEDEEIMVLSERGNELVAIYRTMSDDRAAVYVQLGKFLNRP